MSERRCDECRMLFDGQALVLGADPFHEQHVLMCSISCGIMWLAGLQFPLREQELGHETEAGSLAGFAEIRQRNLGRPIRLRVRADKLGAAPSSGDRQSKIIPRERRCAACGHDLTDFSMKCGWGASGGEDYCHPNEPGHPDCYTEQIRSYGFR